MAIAIKIENLSKQYRLGLVSTRTLSHDLNRWWQINIRGREDPYLKIGETNDRAVKGKSEYVWALKDINLEVQEGEVLGIIGKNGAGKSTLLKILSKVTAPTTGIVRARGRIASLLEVGTGFHQEMTGRENIYLNGSIMGMTKSEVIRKFDEIVDFAGVERYIDTPVKRYSSGMTVRLGFAIAAHLEPEILVVDEVLAVGDAEFQKKAIGKMQDVSRSEGRTVLFVSHNLSAVKQLCTKGIILTDGILTFSGKSQEAIELYLSSNQNLCITNRFDKQHPEGKDVELIYAEIVDANNSPKTEFDISEEIIINLTISCKKRIPNLYGYITINNRQQEVIIETDTFDYLPNCLDYLEVGENNFRIKIRPNILAHGSYFLNLAIASTFSDNFYVDVPGDILAFSIIDAETHRGNRRISKTSHLLKWELKPSFKNSNPQ